MPAIATPSLKTRLERVERVTKDKTVEIFWMCDNCSGHIYRASGGQQTPEDYKYCPFCGARFV